MKRILFVDDEPRVLDGLRNQLRRHRHSWDMRFADSGARALEMLREQPADVVVTDMRMPGMDGAELLRRIQERYTNAVRIVLSGHSELEAALRAVPVAHQFLSKPCKPEVLEHVVERACNLQALINDGSVQSIVASIEKLPAVPQVYSELSSELAAPGASAGSIAKVLQKDVAMCAKLLQLVNSAFFSTSTSISDVEMAVARLGLQNVKSLALSLQVFDAPMPALGGGFTLEGLQRHSLLTATIARDLLTDKRQREDAFAAGLLHDVGKLVMAMELPTHLQRAVAAAEEQRVVLHVAEERLFGVTHAELGAYLLGIWGLPYTVVEAVANHHRPVRVAAAELDATGAVHVANVLANGNGGNGELGQTELDVDYVEAMGLSEHVQSWRETHRSVSRGSGFWS